jgi:hypothetical protein
VALASSSPEARLRQRLVRRWPVGIVGIAATAFLCFAATALVPAKYTAKANILLAPPPASATAVKNGQPNPYQALGGMQPLADVLSRAMVSGGELVLLRHAGLIGSYAVQRDLTTDSPIVVITTTGRTPADALNDLSLVTNAVQPQLSNLQSSVAPQYRVSARPITRDTAAKISRKSQTRALLVAVVAGIVGTVVAISAIDAFLLRRRRRAGLRTAVGAGPAVRRRRRAGLPTAVGAGPQPQPPMAQSNRRRMIAAAPLRSRSRPRRGASGPDVGVTEPAKELDGIHPSTDEAPAIIPAVTPTRTPRRNLMRRPGELHRNHVDSASAEVDEPEKSRNPRPVGTPSP